MKGDNDQGSQGTLTCQREKNNEIHHQHWPKYRHIKDAEEGAHQCDDGGSGGLMPELEFWQPANERPELLRLLCREGGLVGGAVLKAFVLGEGRVDLRLEKGEEDVEEVDAEGVADYIVAACVLRNKLREP